MPRILQKGFSPFTRDVSVLICQIIQSGCHICCNHNNYSMCMAVSVCDTQYSCNYTVLYTHQAHLTSVLCYSRYRETHLCYMQENLSMVTLVSCSSADVASYYKILSLLWLQFFTHAFFQIHTSSTHMLNNFI